jgi:cardiolipin synthase
LFSGRVSALSDAGRTGARVFDITMTGWTLIVAAVVDLIVRVTAIIVVPRNRRPATAVAWLMAIFLIPYIGVLVFLLIGSYKLPKKRRDKQQAINQFILETTEGIELVTKNHAWPPWLESVVELNRNLGV